MPCMTSWGEWHQPAASSQDHALLESCHNSAWMISSNSSQMWVSWGKHLETATCGFYMILACFLADFYHKPASDFFAGFLMCFPCIPATSTGTGHQGRCRFSCAGSKDKHQRNHEQIWLVETSGLEKKAVYFRWNDVDSAWFWMNSDCECVVFSLSNDPCPNNIPSMFVMHEHCPSA